MYVYRYLPELIFIIFLLEDYLTARKKARKAEDTSDLHSDYEPLKKRKIQKRMVSSSDSQSDLESEFSPPPKIRLIPGPGGASSFLNIKGIYTYLIRIKV